MVIRDKPWTRRGVVGAAVAAGAAAMLPGRGMALSPDEAALLTPPVETSLGKVRGARANGVSSFLGIPFGADTGPRRFQPVGPAPAWPGVRDCLAFGAQAPQGSLGSFTLPTPGAVPSPAGRAVLTVMRGGATRVPQSEDCLFLNVYTPDASPARKRPVMVWMHGGGFALGTASTLTYDGGELCRRADVVVVTVNHRLNAMGYLYLAGHSGDFADSGNVGMLDTVLSLEWVRDNIAAFGGDPGNVTIFGESGGASKVGVLLGMPAAKGLFHRAIQQSGPVVRMVERKDAEEHADRTLARLGIGADLGRLRAMDFREIIAAATAEQRPRPSSDRLPLAPVVDGRSLPAHPFDPIATEFSRDVPLIIGTNKDELTLMLGGIADFGTMTSEEVQTRFMSVLGDRGAAGLDLYSGRRPADQPTYWFTAMMTDLMMRSGSLIQARRKAAQGAAPVYLYRLDWESPMEDRVLRAYHGLDVGLVFGHTAGNPQTFGPDAQHLSETMMTAWANFARTGNPSQPGLDWPRHDPAGRGTMIFDAASGAVEDPDHDIRAFWSA